MATRRKGQHHTTHARKTKASTTKHGRAGGIHGRGGIAKEARVDAWKHKGQARRQG